MNTSALKGCTLEALPIAVEAAWQALSVGTVDEALAYELQASLDSLHDQMQMAKVAKRYRESRPHNISELLAKAREYRPAADEALDALVWARDLWSWQAAELLGRRLAQQPAARFALGRFLGEEPQDGVTAAHKAAYLDLCLLQGSFGQTTADKTPSPVQWINDAPLDLIHHLYGPVMNGDMSVADANAYGAVSMLCPDTEPHWADIDDALGLTHEELSKAQALQALLATKNVACTIRKLLRAAKAVAVDQETLIPWLKHIQAEKPSFLKRSITTNRQAVEELQARLFPYLDTSTDFDMFLEQPGVMDYSFVVFDEQERPIGFTIGYKHQSYIREEPETVLIIYRTGVVPEASDRTLGNQMFRYLLGRAEEQGIQAIEFVVRQSTTYRLFSSKIISKTFSAHGYTLTNHRQLDDYDEPHYLLRIEKRPAS